MTATLTYTILYTLRAHTHSYWIACQLSTHTLILDRHALSGYNTSFSHSMMCVLRRVAGMGDAIS